MQVLHEWESERDAVEMLRKTMADCAMDKLLKVQIEGEPEIVERDPAHVKLRVKVKLTADLEAWESLRVRLKPLLQMVAEGKRTVSSLPQTVNPDGTVWFQVSDEEGKKNEKCGAGIGRSSICCSTALTRPRGPSGKCWPFPTRSSTSPWHR